MAIKNTVLGGTDWIDGEVLASTDLNDTFDSMYNTTYATEAYTEITDSSASDYAHNGDTAWSLTQTFTTSSVPTDARLLRIELEGVFNYANSAVNWYLGLMLYDGTDYYKHVLTTEDYWLKDSVGVPNQIGSGSNSSYNTYGRNIVMKVPSGLCTGQTSYSILLYLKTSNSAHNANLKKGFKVRFVFSRKGEAIGTGSQA